MIGRQIFFSFNTVFVKRLTNGKVVLGLNSSNDSIWVRFEPKIWEFYEFYDNFWFQGFSGEGTTLKITCLGIRKRDRQFFLV